MTHDAAVSRKMLALARSGVPSQHEEEARGYLQGRLETYARIVFWAFVALRILELVLYWTCPTIKPDHYELIVAIGVGGLVVMALCWRGLLVRRTLSRRALLWFDGTYTLSAGLVFGATAVLAPSRHE